MLRAWGGGLFSILWLGATSPFSTREGGGVSCFSFSTGGGLCSPFSTGGSPSPFYTWGGVIISILHRVMFSKLWSGGTSYPPCLCTASCFDFFSPVGSEDDCDKEVHLCFHLGKEGVSSVCDNNIYSTVPLAQKSWCFPTACQMFFSLFLFVQARPTILRWKTCWLQQCLLRIWTLFWCGVQCYNHRPRSQFFLGQFCRGGNTPEKLFFLKENEGKGYFFLEENNTLEKFLIFHDSEFILWKNITRQNCSW